MKITRSIVLYDKRTEYYAEDHPIIIRVNEIKQVFTPYQDDPLFYGCYDITKNNVDFFRKYVDVFFEFDFDKYYYCLEAFSS